MKKELLLSTLLIGGAFVLTDYSRGHGGTYRGPGDTVPPGGDGGGGAGGSPPSSGPSGPSNPGGGGPAPGTGRPGQPGSGGTGGGAPITGGASTGPDLTSWQFWWGFNKDPYLNLRQRLRSSGTITGSDDFYLGHGTEAEARSIYNLSEFTIREKIVPALIRALETEKNNDILTGALVALAKIGDSKDFEGHSQFEVLIARFLSDSVQEVRETAAVALGILANPESIDKLEHLALDDEVGRRLVGRNSEVELRTRAFAVYGLGLVGYQAQASERERIVSILTNIIEQDRMATRDVKVAALIAMGLVPIELMEPAPHSGNDHDHIDPKRSRADQVRFLLQYLGDEHNHYLVRAHAPRSIALLLKDAPEQLRERTAQVLLEFVGKRARGQKQQLRESATLALGQIGNCDGDGVDALIQSRLMEGIHDPDQQAKFFSLIALAQTAGRPGSKDAPGGPYDAQALKAVRKHLASQLANGKRSKPWAALSLGVLGHALGAHGLEGSSSDLSHAIQSAMSKITSPDDIGAYAIASGLRRDTEAIEDLRGKLAQISEDGVRGSIAIGLGLLDARSAIEDIQSVLKNSTYRPELLKQAAIALGLLGDKLMVPELTKLLANSKSLASQASLAQALGFIGDSRSVDPLLKMLGDQELTSRARAFAVVALGIVADKEELPWNSKVSVDINYRANTSTLTGNGSTGLLDIL